MFINACQNGLTGCIGVGINTNGTLRLCARNCTEKNGATVLTANTWYRVSLSYIITTSTNFGAKMYLNGNLEASTTNADGTLGAVTTSRAQIGLTNSSIDTWSVTPIMSVWVEDVYVDNRSDQTDCGDVNVTAKRPNANGTTNGFTTQIGSGGSSYGTGHSPQVNERPLSATNGWSMVGAGSAVTEEYNIESISTGDVDITGASIVDYSGWVYSKALTTETAQIIVNGVNSNISLTTTNTMFQQIAGSTTYPAGTGADIGEITATTLTTVSLFECGMVVAYIPASASANNSTKKFLMLLGLGT
jgi:hypothetical protein